MKRALYLALLLATAGPSDARHWRVPQDVQDVGLTRLRDEFKPIAIQLRRGQIEKAFPACEVFIQPQAGEATWLSEARAMHPGAYMGEIGGGRARDPALPALKQRLELLQAQILERLGDLTTVDWMYRELAKDVPLARERLAAMRSGKPWIFTDVEQLRVAQTKAITASDLDALEKLVDPVGFAQSDEHEYVMSPDDGRAFVRALRRVWPKAGVRVYRVRHPEGYDRLERLAVVGLTGRMKGFHLLLRRRADGFAWTAFRPILTDGAPEFSTLIK
jgi:hypothetical protein